MSRWIGAAIAFVTTASSAAACWACPRCPIGETARAQVWATGFAGNLLSVLAPFIVIVATCAYAERIGKGSDLRDDTGS